jgi:hypothetical protein
MLFAIGLPPLLYRAPVSLLPEMAGGPANIFMLFGFTASLALLYNLWIEFRHLSIRSLRAWLPVLLPALVAFQTLHHIREYSVASKDYALQEAAARAVSGHENPYGSWYIYPPLVAQSRALVYDGLMAVSSLSAYLRLTADQGWYLTFYIFQCGQFFLVLLAFHLLYRFALQLGLDQEKALIWVTILFLANNPLFRTLEYNQINLYILNVVLIAIVYASAAPFWSGAAAALGGHIKLYPLLFAAPWFITRRWRALAGAGVAFLAIVILQTGLGRDWSLWQQFVDYYRSIKPLTNSALRDNSTHSIIHNTLRQLELVIGKDGKPNELLVRMGVLLANLLLVGYFFVRYRQWRKRYDAVRDELLRVLSMDTVVAMLLISPMVWEHHYILIMPIMLWAMVRIGDRLPLWLGLSYLLIYLLPTFDLYPFSYHRMAGLLLLLYATSPRFVQPLVHTQPESVS